MSNHLAIATVTATLQRLLQTYIQTDVEGARVTTLRPENLGEGAPESGVNVFLYQILSNPAFGNSHVPGRQRRAAETKQSAAALDLYYLLSFYGNDGELEPQRLLGSVVRSFEDLGTLTPEMLRATIDHRAFPFLSDSDLAEQSEAIRIERQDLELEELANLWSTFFQASYVLSVAYKVTVVVVEGEMPARRALPVRDRYVGTAPNPLQPRIASILASGGRYRPILRDTVLLIRGQQLALPDVRIKLGGRYWMPHAIAPNQLVLDLGSLPAESLQAGMQGLQVVYPQARSRAAFVERDKELDPTARNARSLSPDKISPVDPGNSDWVWVESNLEPFVLRPSILDLNLEAVRGSEDEPRSAIVRLDLDVAVQANQRVVLALNERNTSDPTDYLFELKGQSPGDRTVTIPITQVDPGHYLVRILVDGAESLLTVDDDPQSDTYEQYIAPILVIP